MWKLWVCNQIIFSSLLCHIDRLKFMLRSISGLFKYTLLGRASGTPHSERFRFWQNANQSCIMCFAYVRRLEYANGVVHCMTICIYICALYISQMATHKCSMDILVGHVFEKSFNVHILVCSRPAHPKYCNYTFASLRSSKKRNKLFPMYHVYIWGWGY